MTTSNATPVDKDAQHSPDETDPRLLRRTTYFGNPQERTHGAQRRQPGSEQEGDLAIPGTGLCHLTTGDSEMVLTRCLTLLCAMGINGMDKVLQVVKWLETINALPEEPGNPEPLELALDDSEFTDEAMSAMISVLTTAHPNYRLQTARCSGGCLLTFFRKRQ